jgi:hypothetical protein
LLLLPATIVFSAAAVFGALAFLLLLAVSQRLTLLALLFFTSAFAGFGFGTCSRLLGAILLNSTLPIGIALALSLFGLGAGTPLIFTATLLGRLLLLDLLSLLTIAIGLRLAGFVLARFGVALPRLLLALPRLLLALTSFVLALSRFRRLAGAGLLCLVLLDFATARLVAVALALLGFGAGVLLVLLSPLPRCRLALGLLAFVALAPIALGDFAAMTFLVLTLTPIVLLDYLPQP